MASAHVIAAKRTPFARIDGELSGLSAEDLGARVVRGLLESLPPIEGGICDVIMAAAAGPGGNLARRIALAAGLGSAVPGLTIDRQCGGGLDAIMLACRLVESGAGDVYVAGGVESPSTSPLRAGSSTDRMRDGRPFFPRAAFSAGGYADPGMAEAAEVIARELGITRARQDEYAFRSHSLALDATSSGAFRAEIVPCNVTRGETVSQDSCPRRTLTLERMRRFPSLVAEGGAVTAANSSQIADGAAAVIVASDAVARRLGVWSVRHVDSATAGVDPLRCGLGGAAAVEALARRSHLEAAEIEQLALVEAFAGQAIATIDQIGLRHAQVNPRGGAIALGHPWGASGAMQVVRLFHEMQLGPPSRGLAVVAIAGGMGSAALFASDVRS